MCHSVGIIPFLYTIRYNFLFVGNRFKLLKIKTAKIYLIFLMSILFGNTQAAVSLDIQWNEWEGIYWTIDGSVLRIKGTPPYIPDFAYNSSPWDHYKNQVVSVVIEEGITRIGSRWFENFIYLSSIEIPYTVNSIGQRAFWGCQNLQKISIPHSVISIGEYAFSFCFSLESVELSNSMYSISNGLFSDCGSLNNIEIPNNVSGIGRQAFANCMNLTSINISNKVTYIGDNAFAKFTTIFTTQNAYAAQWAKKNNQRLYLLKDKRGSKSNEMTIEIINLSGDGSRGVPIDLDNNNIISSIKLYGPNGKIIKSEELNLSIKIMKKNNKTIVNLPFREEIPVSEINKFWVVVDGLPDYIYGNIPDEHKYYLSYTGWINKNGNVEIYLIWTDEIYSPPPTPYRYDNSLPEDEIGTYKLKPDGEKEYLIFHTYDICMKYLGRDDLCREHGHCYQK